MSSPPPFCHSPSLTWIVVNSLLTCLSHRVLCHSDTFSSHLTVYLKCSFDHKNPAIAAYNPSLPKINKLLTLPDPICHSLMLYVLFHCPLCLVLSLHSPGLDSCLFPFWGSVRCHFPGVSSMPSSADCFLGLLLCFLKVLGLSSSFHLLSFFTKIWLAGWLVGFVFILQYPMERDIWIVCIILTVLYFLSNNYYPQNINSSVV